MLPSYTLPTGVGWGGVVVLTDSSSCGSSVEVEELDGWIDGWVRMRGGELVGMRRHSPAPGMEMVREEGSVCILGDGAWWGEGGCGRRYRGWGWYTINRSTADGPVGFTM